MKGIASDEPLDTVAACYAETPSRYLLEVESKDLDAVIKGLNEAEIAFGQIGVFADHENVTVKTEKDGRVMEAGVEELLEAWQKPLDW